MVRVVLEASALCIAIFSLSAMTARATSFEDSNCSHFGIRERAQYDPSDASVFILD